MMENAPIILIASFRLPPDIRDRYVNWVREAYWPLLMKVPWLAGIDTHRIVKERPEYNRSMSLFYFESLNHLDNFLCSAEYNAWTKDIEASWAKHGELVWLAVYRLVKQFKSRAETFALKEPETIEDLPVIQLEAPRLSREDEDKYLGWFSRWGYETYIPLLLQLSGLEDYKQYQLVNFDFRSFAGMSLPASHPAYLSVLTFDNLKAYESYEKSLELAACRKAMEIYFSRALDLKWDVQYRLSDRRRK